MLSSGIPEKIGNLRHLKRFFVGAIVRITSLLSKCVCTSICPSISLSSYTKLQTDVREMSMYQVSADG